MQYSGVLGYSVDTAGDVVNTIRSGGNNVRDGVFEFSLAPLADTATIRGVTLRLTTTSLISNTSGLAPVSFVGYAGDGTVTADDHQNASAFAALVTLDFPAGAGVSPAAGSVLDIDLGSGGVALVQSLLATDLLTLRMQTVNFVSFSVASLEHGLLGPAALIVEYEMAPVPLPPAAALLGSATFALLGACRRRAAG